MIEENQIETTKIVRIVKPNGRLDDIFLSEVKPLENAYDSLYRQFCLICNICRYDRAVRSNIA